METIIRNKLSEIEQEHNCRILLAVESGSRAYGIASPNSDFDIRFIYIRPKEEYLKLNTSKDVITFPIHNKLDIVGWDLDKTLKLLHKSNPAVFEWLLSPIVYKKDDNFIKCLSPLLDEYFSVKRSLWHYFNKAKEDYKYFLMQSDTMPIKKGISILRSILACRWILGAKTPPPMLFLELVNNQSLLDIKEIADYLSALLRINPETKEVPSLEKINHFINKNLLSIRKDIDDLPAEKSHDLEPLNQVFLTQLGL